MRGWQHWPQDNDYEEPDPPQLLKVTSHTAQQLHDCASCEGYIQPGQRYTRTVIVDDNGWHLYKTHDDPDTCRATRAQLAAWRRENEDIMEVF